MTFMNFKSLLMLSFSMLLSTGALAAVSQYDATADGAMPVCTGNQIPAGQGALADPVCRVTPTVFKVTMYEMGLCSAHPFGVGGTGDVMDKSTCKVIFSNSSGFEVDMAASVGTSTPLEGTSTPPQEGTYKYPYAIMGPTFTVNAVILGEVGTGNAGNSYSGKGDCTVTAGAAGPDCPNLLSTFGNNCVSGYINGQIDIGTIDGFLTKGTDFDRRDNAETAGGVCTNMTDADARMVGVMNLTTPFKITPSTKEVIFKFVVTNYGVQVESNAGGAVTSITSAPFSGYFEAVE
jgi:hypothetical protein